MLSILDCRDNYLFPTKTIFVVLISVVLTMALPQLYGQGAPLTVERVVTSLPSLIGTAPAQPVWSPDSTKLAFLWNDEGMPFRDLWLVPGGNGEPKQLTDMKQDFRPSPSRSTDPIRALAQKLAAQTERGVSQVVWKPDGTALVFTYRGDLFRIDADGGGLERLTHFGGVTHPAFSPDSRFLSFLKEGDLWLWNQETDDLVKATQVGAPPIGTAPGCRYNLRDVEFGTYVWDSGMVPYSWSSDSRRIALHFEDRRQMRKVPFPYYLSDETEPNFVRRGYPGDFDEVRAIAVYSVAEGRFRLVDLEDKTYRRFNSFIWSPDGTELLLDQSSEDGTDRWIHVVKAEDLSVREVWHDRGENRLYPNFVSLWQSDGQGILFVGDLDDRYRLYALSSTGGEAKPLTRGDWDVDGFRGQSLTTVPPLKETFFVSNQKSPYERHVYRMPEGGGSPKQVTTLPGVHLPFLAPDGSKLAVLHSSDTTPTELYVVDLEQGSPERRVTHSPPAEFDDYPWIVPRYVTFKSRIDDYTLHGRLLEPPKMEPGKKYPVIMGSAYSNRVRNQWAGARSTLQQFLALEGGYIGFQVDLRGSTGYGRAFREAFHKDTGGGDVEDLHSAVEYLKSLPYVDPDRIGIWGSSYGGTMTVFALFQKPGLFKAGVAGAPAVSGPFFGTDDIALMGLPNSDPDVYRRVSAINQGEALQDHLLIIHGMQDCVVPFKTSVMLAEKLMLLGKNFDFAFAPGAGHGWSQKEHYALYMMRKLVEHFDRYLGRGPSSEGRAN